MTDSAFTIAGFLKDRASTVVLGCLCAVVVLVLSSIFGVTRDASIVLALTVLLSFAIALSIDYSRRSRFYREALDVVSSLESAYYTPSVLNRPAFLEGQILYDVCAAVAAADAELLAKERHAAAENGDYVQLWTHEVKTPIAAAKLALSRVHGEEARILKREIERIEVACERALYSSKAYSVAVDYSIREISLAAQCREACKSMANLLIEQGVQPVFDLEDGTTVLADEQWVRFVLRQVVSNSVKYEANRIVFSQETSGANTAHGCTVLKVTDNGIGIPENEIGSVFAKGFSGSNGRSEGTSTGMGLYLTARACESMGVGLTVSSDFGCGTTVAFSFPHDRSKLNLT